AFAGCEHHLDAAKIPLPEATRLLFNRCTGLLLAKELLNKRELTPEDADFVGRNIAKARLALGDAVLAALGKYHWSCLERRSALDNIAASAARLPGTAMSSGTGVSPVRTETDGQDACATKVWAEITRSYQEGVEFKLHPRRILKLRDEFRAEHEVVS